MPVGTTTHISLAGHEYLVKPYSYSKRQAPQFGARFSTGDPDFNNFSIWQHWAQRCFIGGVDQDDFNDDAMYDEGVGVDTTEHEKVTLTRDLARGTGANWTISSGSTNATNGFKACIYNNKLYILTLPTSGVISHLWQYDPATDGWTRITSLDTPAIRGVCIATFDGKLYVGGSTTGGNTGRLAYSSGTLTTWTVVTNPSGLPATSTVTAMRAFQQKLYVAFSATIWRQKDDQTWDGNVHFYKANQNSDSNSIASMETHLGFLYMLSYNGHVHRTDGNATFDIWSWDGQTHGISIRSFDGRLFILTFEYTNTTNVGFGCLYQMSGSAVTQLKRWGKGTDATRIGNMTVWDRKLFYGASNLLGFGGRSGFGVAEYDPVEDAHSIVASNADIVTYPKGVAPGTNFIVDDQIHFGGALFAFVRGHGAFKTPYQPRDIRTFIRRFDTTSAGGTVAALNGGWLSTSNYDAGTPGVRKLWRRITVDYVLPTAACSIIPEYSINDGATWTALTAITTTNGVTNTRARFQYLLNNVISVSLKLRFTLRSTDATRTPIFNGFVVSYLPLPEPDWTWTFTIPLSALQEAADGSVNLTYDTEAEMLYLENIHRSKALVSFTDIDGKVWASNGPGVLIHDIEFRVAQMTQPLEGEVVITLIEAVETY